MFVGRLRAALAGIDAPCPFNDNCVAFVKWDAESRRHRIKIVHPDPSCPALTPGVFRDRADAYLISLLELYGVRVAEYADDDLVGWHDTR